MSREGSRGARVVLIATLLAMALGAGLRLPALLAPFHSDDYEQIAMLRGEFLIARPAWDLFWFGPRSSEELARLVDFGFDPWWTVEGHRLSMWRPLSSLLIAADHALFGAKPWLWHLHSLFWLLLLIGSVARLFGKLLAAPVAACAVVLFALDAALGTPLTWLANRSTLVATSLGTLALLAHIRSREGSSRPAGWLAAGAWLLAFAAGEYAFGMLAYLVAYEGLGARDGPRRRAAALLPALGAALLYLATRAALGHGVGGGELYVGPGQPLRYLARVASHVPVLAGDLVFSVPAVWSQIGSPWRVWLITSGWFTPETWVRLPDWSTVHVTIGCLALAAAGLGLRALSRSEAAAFRTLRWLAAGSLLSLFVVAGTAPSARLLSAPALGAAALLAGLLLHGMKLLRAHRARGALLAASILGAHGLLGAYFAWSDAAGLSQRFEALRQWALRAEIPRRARHIDIVAVSTSDFATGPNLPWARWFFGFELPRSYRLLSGAQVAHDLLRIDDHTLELDVLSADLEGAFTGSTYRGRDAPLRARERIVVGDMRVELVAVERGNPRRFRVSFGRELEDPSLLFVHAYPDGLRRLVLPPVGGRLRLPRAALPWERR